MSTMTTMQSHDTVFIYMTCLYVYHIVIQ